MMDSKEANPSLGPIAFRLHEEFLDNFLPDPLSMVAVITCTQAALLR